MENKYYYTTNGHKLGIPTLSFTRVFGHKNFLEFYTLEWFSDKEQKYWPQTSSLYINKNKLKYDNRNSEFKFGGCRPT